MLVLAVTAPARRRGGAVALAAARPGGRRVRLPLGAAVRGRSAPGRGHRRPGRHDRAGRVRRTGACSRGRREAPGARSACAAGRWSPPTCTWARSRFARVASWARATGLGEVGSSGQPRLRVPHLHLGARLAASRLGIRRPAGAAGGRAWRHRTRGRCRDRGGSRRPCRLACRAGWGAHRRRPRRSCGFPRPCPPDRCRSPCARHRRACPGRCGPAPRCSRWRSRCRRCAAASGGARSSAPRTGARSHHPEPPESSS